MPAMPEMPVMPALPDLRLPGFIRSRFDRSAPARRPIDRPPSPSRPPRRTRPRSGGWTILRALESGELDVPTAMDRLAALDDGATDGAALR